MTTTVQPATIEEKWAARTIAVDGSHLGWTGAYMLRWEGRTYSPGAVAFRVHHGRDPIGSVRAECGHRRCLQRGHIEDGPGRARLRSLLRAVRGLPPVDAWCHRGHDQTLHGRLQADGVAYCYACKNDHVETPLRLHGDARMRVAVDLRARYYAGDSIHGLMDQTGRTYGYVHDLLALAGTQFRPRGYNAEFHAGRWSA